MPETVTETPVTETETFSSFRGGRGSAAPADVEVKVPDVTKTGTTATGDQDASSNDPDPAASKAADGSDPSSEQGKIERRKAKIQSEIDSLVAKREQARREVEEIEAKRRPAETTSAATPTKATEDPKPVYPDAADPKYNGDYAKWKQDEVRWTVDTAKWEIREEERQAQAKAAAERQAAQRKEIEASNKKALEEFQSRSDEYAEDHEDYPELLKKFKDSAVSAELGAAVALSEDGPALLHHLMGNTEEMKRIEALPTAWKRLEALFELKYKLANPEPDKPAKEKPVSQAPRTGTRVTSAGSPSGGKEPSNFNDFRKKRFA